MHKNSCVKPHNCFLNGCHVSMQYLYCLQKEKPTSMSAEELLALLRSDVMLDDIAQKRAISDEVGCIS